MFCTTKKQFIATPIIHATAIVLLSVTVAPIVQHIIANKLRKVTNKLIKVIFTLCYLKCLHF